MTRMNPNALSINYVNNQLDFVYDTAVTSRDKSHKLKEMLYDEMLRFHPELVDGMWCFSLKNARCASKTTVSKSDRRNKNSKGT